MIPGRPARLRAFDYAGFHCYHVRCGTWNRAEHFRGAALVHLARDQLLQLAPAHEFEILAYCFMPDHAHVLLSALAPTAVLPPLISSWKQRTGYQFARTRRAADPEAGRLWQPAYFDRVLRDDEQTRAVALYIVANPLRAGLASRVGEYPFAWCKWEID